MADNDGGGNNAGGSGAVDRPQWLDSLPDAHKQNQGFMQFKEPADAWNKFDSLLKAEGKAVVVPDEKATDAERGAFFNKLGRPESPDKYSFTKPSDLPEGVYDENAEKIFRQFAHQQGLTDAQAKGLHGWYYGLIKEGFAKQAADQKAEQEKAVNDLKNEWKGDTFKENSELAKRAFMKFGGDGEEIKQFFETTRIGNLALGDHPIFLKVFAAIGKAIADDSLNVGKGGLNGELSDEDKAKARFPKTYPK